MYSLQVTSSAIHDLRLQHELEHVVLHTSRVCLFANEPGHPTRTYM